YFDGKLLAEEKLQFIRESYLAGLGDSNRKHVVLHFERNEVVAEHQIRLNGSEKFRVNPLLAQVYERKAVPLGELTSVFALVLFFRAEGRSAVDDRILLCSSHGFRSNRRRSFR